MFTEKLKEQLVIISFYTAKSGLQNESKRRRIIDCQNHRCKNVFLRFFYFKIKKRVTFFLFSQRFLLIKKNVGQQFQL